MRWLILVNSIILIIEIGVIFTSLVFAYELEEYYPLDQGNSWTYSAIENEESGKEIVRIEGKEIIRGVETVKMMFAENDYKCIAIDSEGIKKYKDFDEDEYKIYNPPKFLFPNIDIGQVKEYSTSWIKYGMRGEKKEEGVETGQIKLESIENIEVPAGKFTGCLKFSLISNEKTSDGGYESSDCTIWLAPAIGKVKEFCIDTEYDVEAQKEDTFIEIVELVSAVVDGKRIGRQE